MHIALNDHWEKRQLLTPKAFSPEPCVMFFFPDFQDIGG
jgi:hypothetical protein